MDKYSYFKLGLDNRLYAKKSWVISLFSVFTIDEHYKNDLYNFKLFKDNKGFSFYLDGKYIPIENADANIPLLNLKDELEIDNRLCLNCKEKITTTYGRLLFNIIALVEPFKDKIPYINKQTNIGNIESIIAERLQDVPEDNASRNNKYIYVDEYLKFCKNITYLAGWMQLCVWAETPKLLVAPTGIAEYKKKLLEENKDKLNDPNVIIDIEKKLIAYDADYLKGDPGGEYFANGEKSRNIVRKKLFLMYGMDSTDPGVFSKPVTNSLEEGWDINNFPQMNDALRAGSYGRGFETQKGGELSKWLLRASSSIRIRTEDCGTTLGFRTLIDDNNYKNIVKLYYLNEKETILIEDINHATSLIGKVVTLRSALYCKTEGTDLCKYCVGEKLAINPEALSSSIADFGSEILNMALAKFHGKEVTSKPFKMELIS